MNQSHKKTYYYDLGQQTMMQIRASGQHPSILVHTCCAVCAGVPLEQLTPYFDVTLFYDNSNIYPQSEFAHRLEELERILRQLYPSVHLVVCPYDHENYMSELRAYKDDPEGGRRCHLCYEKRMNDAFAYATTHHYDYVTTVMTISRQKDSRVLNEIGARLSIRYPSVHYFFSDFKKHGGQQRSIDLRNERHLYQQTYCGCEYSLRHDLHNTSLSDNQKGFNSY